MKGFLLSTVAMLIMAVSLPAQTAPDAEELTKLLNDFLSGAGRNDVTVHERIWAEDLIYTGSVGRRVGKSDIINDLRKSPTRVQGQRTIYTAEEIRIQQYGNTAIVAFRLVGTVERGKKTEVTKYLNTGTFIKRKGKWQAVAWQSTRLPRPDETAKRELAAVEADFQQAMLASDVDTLEKTLDESFMWTRSGQQLTRQQLIDELRTGQLKYSKLETKNVTTSIHGDTGVVRGESPRQLSAIPGQSGQADATPFTVFYTLTFVNKAGPWKAVAMHTSRP